MVEALHRCLERGNPYHIRIDPTVPRGGAGGEARAKLAQADQQVDKERIPKEVTTEAPHKDIYVAIGGTFDVMRREMESYVGRQRRDVKHHETIPHVRVRSLFP